MSEHTYDFGDVIDADEISGDDQLVLAWCTRHEIHEWTWVDRSVLAECGYCE